MSTPNPTSIIGPDTLPGTPLEPNPLQGACALCRYAVRLTADYLACQRFPPSVIDDPGKIPSFPTVENTDWCGEFKS